MKKEMSLETVRELINSRIASLNMSKSQFAEDVIENGPEEMRSKSKNSILVALSPHGAQVSFPILSACMTYLKLGELKKEVKVEHLKTTTLYVED